MHVNKNGTIVRYALAFAVLFSFSSIFADDWPQFRGPQGTGIAPSSAKPPTKWSESNFVWDTALPGTGWSSPVFEENRIWLTTAVSQKATPEEIAKKLEGVQYAEIKTAASSVDLKALCIDMKSGKVLHELQLAKSTDPAPINPMNSYASPTPAIAAGLVVCHFGNYGTWCLDAKTGKTRWKQSFVVDHSVGPGSSPVIVEDNVILVCDGTDKQFVVAVDLKTGEEVWRTSRPSIRSTNGEYRKAYCTPMVIEVDGRQQAIIPGAQWTVAYEPKTGKEIWRVDHGQGFSVTPMACFESGLVIFSTGYTQPEFVAIDPTGSGDVTQTHIVWRKRGAPTMPSMISHDGKIFAISDRGIMSCLDAKTGKTLQRKRIGGNFSASPLLANGRLFLSSREGKVTVIDCSESLSPVAENQLGKSIMASPAIIGNDLILRTESRLLRITGTSSEEPDGTNSFPK